MAVTIKDIAKVANVSHTTVSRALNNSSFIKLETRRKILALAKEMNYVPNYNAKSLVMKKSYIIGLFFTTITSGTSSSFFTEVLNAVISELDENYNLAIRGLDTYEDFSSVVSEKFDGIIVMSQKVEDDKFIQYVKEKEIPMVVLNRTIDDKEIINISSPDRESVEMAVTYLIENNHEKIACISGISGFKSTEERRAGYLNALRANNILVRPDYLVSGKYTMESGYSAMKALLKLSDMPTAVFCSNDDMAIGAIRAAADAGLHVPTDISIMGFDSIASSDFTTPRLTTVRRKVEEISQLAAKKLIMLINNETSSGEQTILDAVLVERESVINLKKN